MWFFSRGPGFFFSLWFLNLKTREQENKNVTEAKELEHFKETATYLPKLISFGFWAHS